MATSSIDTKKSATPDQFLASNTIIEDSKEKHIQRVILNNAQGSEYSAVNALTVTVSNGATETTLQEVRDAIKAQISLATSVWTDDSGAYYVRRDNVNEGTGAITVSFTDAIGATVTPGAGLRPLASADRDVSVVTYEATASGTGFAIGDILDRMRIVDVNTNAASIIWFNGAAVISAPSAASVQVSNEEITANIGDLNGAATEATLLSIDSKTPALSAGAVPVSLPTAQIVTLTPPAAITGFATEATLATLSAKLPASLGAKTSATSLSITPATDSLFPVNISQIGGVAADSTGLAIKRSQDYAAANRYFSASINPAIGTPIAINAAAQSAFVSTAPTFLILAPTKPVNIDKIVLQIGGIGATITALQVAVTIDTTNRFTSGGTTLAGRSTLNQSAPTAVVRVAGVSPIVATASGATDHRLYRGVIKSAVPVANDVYNLVFGNDNSNEPNASNSTLMTKAMPPLIVPAGGSALIYIYGTGQTAAPTFEGMLYFEE